MTKMSKLGGHVLQARVAIMQRHLIQKERHQQIKFKTCGI